MSALRGRERGRRASKRRDDLSADADVVVVVVVRIAQLGRVNTKAYKNHLGTNSILRAQRVSVDYQVLFPLQVHVAGAFVQSDAGVFNIDLRTKLR